MFSWICARCGRDNPPSANRCLSCGASFDAPETEPAPVPPPQEEEEPVFRAPSVASAAPAPTERFAPPTQERYSPPPERYAAPPERPAPPPERPAPPLRTPFSSYGEPAPRATASAKPISTADSTTAAAPARASLPTWLLTLLFFVVIVGVGAAIYYGIQYFRGGKASTATGLDTAANVARTKLTNPLQKSIEVVGIRLVEGAHRKPEAKFVVINHSPNDIDSLNATVTLWASTSRSEEDSVGTFTFKITSLPGTESKEMTSPLNTKLKFYELPDWQNATPEVQITSP